MDEMDEVSAGLYVGSVIEQICCTCKHWAGTRVMGEEDVIFSLKNLKSICNFVNSRGGDGESGDRRTLPDNRCGVWQKWCEIGMTK